MYVGLWPGIRGSARLHDGQWLLTITSDDPTQCGPYTVLTVPGETIEQAWANLALTLRVIAR